MITYMVEKHPLGVVVRGSFPVDDMAALVPSWGDYGLTMCSGRLAAALGATLVVCDPEDESKWLLKLEQPQVKP